MLQDVGSHQTVNRTQVVGWVQNEVLDISTHHAVQLLSGFRGTFRMKLNTYNVNP